MKFNKATYLIVNKIQKLNYRQLFFYFALIIIIYTCLYRIYKFQKLHTSSGTQPQIISELYLILNKQKEITEDNTNNTLLQFNNNIFKQADKIISKLNVFNKKKIKIYYTNANLCSKEVIKLLNILEIIAINYNYQEFNGIKARELMKFAKDIAEKYVVNRSKYKFHFKNLNYDEILTELSVVENLPQIYTKIVYALARTYLLQGDKMIGFELFKLSEYLGYKLKLFEGVISTLNKAIILTHLIEIDINNNKFYKNYTYILDNIETYKAINNDNNYHIINFHPEKQNKFIIPNNNLFNCVYSSDFIIRSYTQLIRIVAEQALKQQYFMEICKQLNTLKKYGTFEKAFSQVSRRQIGNFYNSLASCLLYANIHKVTTHELIYILKEEFKFDFANELDTAQSLCEKTLSISRYTDYSKADAYNILAKILMQKLKASNLSLEKKDTYQTLINEYISKRDDINRSLNRDIFKK